MRHREGRQLTQGHMASYQQDNEQKLGVLTLNPEPCYLMLPLKKQIDRQIKFGAVTNNLRLKDFDFYLSTELAALIKHDARLGPMWVHYRQRVARDWDRVNEQPSKPGGAGQKDTAFILIMPRPPTSPSLGRDPNKFCPTSPQKGVLSQFNLLQERKRQRQTHRQCNVGV